MPLVLGPQEPGLENEGEIKVSPSWLRVGAETGGCLRRAMSQKLGYRGAPGAAALNGTRGHKLLEEWLKHGAVPDFTTKIGRACKGAIDLLPKPEDGAEVERNFTLDWGNVVFHGFVDWSTPEKTGDHKFSSNPKRYGLTARTLPLDEQAILYTMADHEFYGTESREAEWIYNSTTNYTSYSVKVPMDRPDVEQKIETVLAPRARRMLTVLQGLPTKDDAEQDRIDALNGVPNRPSHCDSTGRWCDFFEHCEMWGPTPRKRDHNMPTIAERMAANRKAKAAGNTAAEEATAETSTPAKASGVRAKMAALKDEPTSPPEAEKQTEAVVAEVTATEAAEPEPTPEPKARKTRTNKTAAAPLVSAAALLVQQLCEGSSARVEFDWSADHQLRAIVVNLSKPAA